MSVAGKSYGRDADLEVPLFDQVILGAIAVRAESQATYLGRYLGS